METTFLAILTPSIFCNTPYWMQADGAPSRPVIFDGATKVATASHPALSVSFRHELPHFLWVRAIAFAGQKSDSLRCFFVYRWIVFSIFFVFLFISFHFGSKFRDLCLSVRRSRFRRSVPALRTMVGHGGTSNLKTWIDNAGMYEASASCFASYA